MEKVGVEAVVEGLSGFLGDMKQMDSAISGLVPGTKLLDNAFGFLGDTINGVVNFALNTLAHALGELVADAVEFVIQKLGELAQATIEAGGEFQTLELRLQTLNFNTLTESGKAYNEATAQSIELTKQQLEWIQKLAVTTPYDAQDIANVFTLARSYGFANDEAQTLTESITNFAAGMGLGNTEITRIIINFGQMVQQGKVTQREMNDLARGAFVPVNDILNLMAKNLNMSTEELTKFRQTGESVPAFMEAFIQLVEQRFTGSAEKMASTFQGASANLKDLIKSLGGMNIVKPILDVIGKRISDFISSLTEGKRWDALVQAAKDVGNAISAIVLTLVSLLPSAKSVSEGVVSALEGIADWLNKHRGDITDWIILANRWINDVLIPDIKKVVKWLFGTEEETGAIQKFALWLQDTFVPAIAKAADWVQNVLVPFLKNDLEPVFLALLPLAGALADVLAKAFGGEPNQSFTDWIHNSLIPGIQSFTDWIIQNKDEIALWVNRLVVATVEIAIFIGIIGLVIAAITNVVAAWTNWLLVSKESDKWLALLGIAAIALGAALLGVASPLLLVAGAIAAIILIIKVLITQFQIMKDAFTIWVDYFKNLFAIWKDTFEKTINEMVEAAKSGDWAAVGKAFVDGIVSGITQSWSLVLDLISKLAQNAIEHWKEAFHINFDITDALGMTQGNPPGSPASVPAGSSVNSSVTNTNNYNLSINSNATAEPIVQDFNMMQALHGQ